MFTLSFGMVPEANREANWKTVADWVSAALLSYFHFAPTRSLSCL
jgi:hypothetical protein